MSLQEEEKEDLSIPQELLDMGAPHSEEFHKMLYGFAYRFYASGKNEDAIRFFKFLTTLNPFQEEYWKGLAAARQQNKEYEKAIEAYGIAATLDETSGDPYIHLHAADCFLALGNIDKALEALDSVKALAANHEDEQKLLTHVKLMRQAWRKKFKIAREVSDE